MQKILEPKAIRIALLIIGVILFFALLYWLINAAKASKLHLENEREVAKRLESGELQITTKNG